MGMAGGWIEGAGVGALCCNTMLPDNTSFVYSILCCFFARAQQGLAI